MHNERVRAIRNSIKRRFHQGTAKGAQCFALVDVLRLTCGNDPRPALRTLSEFESSPQKALAFRKGRFQDYGVAQWFQHTASDLKFCVLSNPREPWLAPFRVTLFADDIVGLRPEQILRVLELLPSARVTLCELALDFSPLSVVDREYVRRHGLFGKSRTATLNQITDYYGSRRGGKFVKQYFKPQNCSFRVEFRMQSKFMRAHGITDIFDFPKFAGVIPRKQMLFVRLDEALLRERLEQAAHGSRQVERIMCKVANEKTLTAALSYLRKQVGLKNVRRLVVPLRSNALVKSAIEKLADEWRIQPTKLQPRKSPAKAPEGN